jgi:hypothetical protein
MVAKHGWMRSETQEPSAFVGSIEETLRGDNKQFKYGLVFLPFDVLCRVFAVLK